MTLIKIESHRDYELYVKKTIAKTHLLPKSAESLKVLLMQSFQDGQRMAQNNLKVKI